LERRLRSGCRDPAEPGCQYGGRAGQQDRSNHQRLAVLPLDACAGRSDVGGKAGTLARMRAAKMVVPDGTVLLHGEGVGETALAAELARLGGDRFAVRSSASLEDAAGGSAAGLFTSVIGVPAAEVARAVAEVRASLSSPALTAYREART